MAPFNLWPVLCLTLPVLVWLVDTSLAAAPRRPAAHAATITWWFAFGYFAPGLFWIGEAFLVEAEKFAALLPFAVTLMPAGLALFWAAAAAVASLAWRPGFARVLALALALAAAEWLRGHVLTGFPWNVLGYALTAPDALMQSASVLGIYGLTLLTVPLLASPLVLWQDARSGTASSSAPAAAAVTALVFLVAMFAWGTLRLSTPTTSAEPAVKLRIVQPSIPQREKWKPELQRRNFERHLQLTGQSPAGAIDGAIGRSLVVWPEAALPFRPLEVPEALAAIGTVVPAGAHLATGIIRVEQPTAPGARRRALNSLSVHAPGDGRAVAVYDKIHLVPFGEYLPFQSTLEAIGLEQLSRMRGGFDAGPDPRPMLRVPGLPAMLPLICYEAIFPAAVVQGPERPKALLNVTNDGWFGNTTGPRQHLHQSRVRAVEEGLPLIRAANNGISAVIDAHGRITARLGLDVVGTLDADLPAPIDPPVYARLGDWTFAAMLLAGLAWLGLLLRAR
jgi:apolipoprotein N-acyltransferase